MSVPQLRIESTHAKIGIHTTRPLQNIEQPKAELNMRQVPAQMIVNRTQPLVLIDQSEARAEMGLKGVFRTNREYAARGEQAIMERIAKIAQDGSTLRSIENFKNGEGIKQLSKQSLLKPMASSQITFIPSYGSVKIEGIPGEMQVDWLLGGVEMNPNVYTQANHNYTPGKVEVYVAQKNSIRMWVEPNVDTRL